MHCTMSSNFPSRTNYSKIYLQIYLQSLNYQRQLEGGGGYKPIKNILTFEYHNGIRGWMLPRLLPTKKGFFAFLYPPTLITGNFRKMRLDTCAWEIKCLTHVLLKRLRQPQTLI